MISIFQNKIKKELESVRLELRHSLSEQLEYMLSDLENEGRDVRFLDRTHRIKQLIERGADPRTYCKIKKHSTPTLHLACYFNDVELVQFLLESGAKANAQDSNGDTPWHLLDNSQEAVECLKLLLEAGADPMIKNKMGEDQFNFDYKGDMLVFLKEKCNIA